MQAFSLPKLSAALLLCGLAAHAGAVTVLDTYEPGELPFGWPTPLADGKHIAVAFDITSTTTIASILSSIDGVGGITVGVLARQGASPDGLNWLYSAHLVDPWADTSFSPSGWTLAPGSYWLAAVGDAGFAGQWQSGGESPNAVWGFTTSPGVWQMVTSQDTGAPAVRITVSAVPEPATHGLMALGALVVAGALRRKQQQG